MRSFIRHPTDIPIEIRLGEQTYQHEPLRNVCGNGLCFRHPEAALVGSNIVVRIAFTVPAFEASCRVTWCQADGNAWQVGVEFLNQDDLFRARMVEQICHIELYRRAVRESEGRDMSSHEAALEWIERYAGAFPFSDSNSGHPQNNQK